MKEFKRSSCIIPLLMEKLKVPLFRQDPNSVECGLATLAMVYDYFEIRKSLADLRKEVSLASVGTYSPQLGLHLLGQGFDVEIVTRNPLLLEKEDRNLPQEELLLKFKQMLDSKSLGEARTQGLKYFVSFIEAGGKVDVKIPDVGDLKEEIGQRRPVIVFLTNSALYNKNIAKLLGKPFDYTFHVVVVTGIGDDEVQVNDPYWGDEGGVKRYPVDEFLYSVYASSLGDVDNGSFIKFKKK